MWRTIVIGSRIGALAGALAFAPSARAQSRGELLYATHCVACHTTQMHWREKRLATDWSSLRAQVQRWQGTAMLQWNEEDVLAVTRHLNDTIYRFAQPDRLTSQRLSIVGAL